MFDYTKIKTYKDWNYKSEIDFSTGYENEYDFLNSFKKEAIEKLKEKEIEEIIKNVFSIYRKKNIYPIFYFNDNGIKNEILRCFNRDVEVSGTTMDFRYTQGNTLLKFLFPNFQRAYSGWKDNGNYINSFDKFFDDEMLIGAIRFQLKHDSPIPLRLLNTMSLYRDRTPTNFSPMRSKAIYEKYCQSGSLIYDFSCGYGGRMLGALTSKNNYKYIGVEPNTETFDNLNILGEIISDTLDKKNSYEILKTGSEDFVSSKNSVDFAFSSPPYFNLEKYSEEETQCYNKFKNMKDWMEGYVEKTIENIYSMVKENGLYAVNISDFRTRNQKVDFVYKWIEISEKIGFEHVETIDMKLSNRGGNKNKNITGGSSRKEEKIYVFKKSNHKKTKSNIPLFVREKIRLYKEQMKFANSIKKEILDWSIENNFENIEKEI